jgi:hypothetical protein
MKKFSYLLVFALLLAGLRPLAAQDYPEEYLGLPGDNLNLYAVMNLFQESETLEGFERSLNDPETMINNLDLNGNNLVDYIMVLDYQEDNIHSIVLRVALNKNEFQDVAVFTVEKFRDGSVQIQLIGDEALYGKNYIIEPIYAETPNPGYTGTVTQQTTSSRRNVTVVHTTYYEVASWPVIVYISRPTYRVYRSSWGWGYYPTYWSPWAPNYWHYYYGYHYNYYDHYYAYYRPWRHHRSRHYHHTYYSGIRTYSPTVVVNINKGSYRQTYSRPERRSDGEKLYAQRRASGSTTLPTRSRTASAEQKRQSAGQATPASTRASKTSSEVRSAPVRTDNPTRVAPRQSTDVKRQRPEAVQQKSRQVETQRPATPKRETSVRTERTRESSAKSREIARPAPERTTAPARSVERTAPKRERTATPAAPKVSTRERSKPSSVQSSKPQRSASPAPTVRSAPDRSSNKAATRSNKSSKGSKDDSGSSKRGRR